MIGDVMPATRSLDPRSGPSGHVVRIEVLEPLRKSLGEVKETADQFEQAQALLRAIERFSCKYAVDRRSAGAPVDPVHRDHRRLVRGKILARVIRRSRRSVLAAKG
ncbi:hypothetical protein QMZ05_17395 [Bradyrhizobium sp. INPA03-11B]|uniref:hypothetical protein n=1 Tax=Bradyrhizobium sp. INPA03-11B TaxID=418598 RepID=UPI00338E5B65